MDISFLITQTTSYLVTRKDLFCYWLSVCFETSPVALRNNCYSFHDQLKVLEYENLLPNPSNY